MMDVAYIISLHNGLDKDPDVRAKLAKTTLKAKWCAKHLQGFNARLLELFSSDHNHVLLLLLLVLLLL